MKIDKQALRDWMREVSDYIDREEYDSRSSYNNQLDKLLQEVFKDE